MADLSFCESGFNENALNKKDLDGTASYGLMQFKPSNLLLYGRKYGILPDIEPAEIQNIIYDGELQLRIAAEMIKNEGHKEKWWLQQFPGCFLKYKNKWINLGLI